MNIPRPPTPPIPPEPGALRRVQRAARLRKLRVPAGGLAAVLAVSLALTSGGAPQSSDRLDVTSTPSPTDYHPSPVPTAVPSDTVLSPLPTAVPTASATRSAQPSARPTTTATPTPVSSPHMMPFKGCGEQSSAGLDITGVVVDGGGRPVSGMTVTGARCEGENFASGTRVAVTDAEGRFRIPCVEHWAVVAAYQWYGDGSRTTSANVGWAWLGKPFSAVPCGSDHRVVVPAGGTVEATFTDDAGNRLPGVRVGLHTAGDEATAFALVSTDSNGMVRFSALTAGRYFFYDGYAPYRYFDITAGETTTITVILEGRPGPTPKPTQSGI